MALPPVDYGLGEDYNLRKLLGKSWATLVVESPHVM
jgi:hypothetical protein